MANTAVFSAAAQWTPPSAPVNSGQSTFTINVAYNAQNVGAIDVPSGTAPSTVFNIPFGSISKAKLFIFKNLMTSDVDLRLNGSLDAVTIPPQGQVVFGGPTDPTTGVNPLASAAVTTLVAPTNLEAFQYWLFGD